jgi:hypothetical protein
VTAFGAPIGGIPIDGVPAHAGRQSHREGDMRRFISCTVVGLCLIGASLSPVMAAPPYNKLNAFAEALERVHDN